MPLATLSLSLPPLGREREEKSGDVTTKSGAEKKNEFPQQEMVPENALMNQFPLKRAPRSSFPPRINQEIPYRTLSHAPLSLFFFQDWSNRGSYRTQSSNNSTRGKSHPVMAGGFAAAGGPKRKGGKHMECWGADKPFANITENNLTAKSIAITVSVHQAPKINARGPVFPVWNNRGSMLEI